MPRRHPTSPPQSPSLISHPTPLWMAATQELPKETQAQIKPAVQPSPPPQHTGQLPTLSERASERAGQPS